MDENCGNCRFYSPRSTGQAANFCKRYPPYNQRFAGLPLQAYWPLTFDHYWCGEWQPKKQDQGSDQ